MSEATLVRKIIELIRKNGGEATKFHGGAYTRSGEPDIFAVFMGIPLLIEAKVPGKKPTKIQLSRIKKWQKAGALSFWTDNIKDVKDAIAAVIKEKSKAQRSMRELRGGDWQVTLP